MNYFQLVDEALEYIEIHLVDDINIEILSAHVHLSKFHFHRVFRSLTGYTIAGYIDRRRLDLANQYLSETDWTILQIAINCGFKSHEVFTRKYKKYFDVTPSIFRKDGLAIKPFERLSIIERDFINKNNELIVKFELREMNHKRIRGRICNNGYDDDNEPNTISNFIYDFATPCFEQKPEGHLYLGILYRKDSIEQIEYFVGFDEQAGNKGYEPLDIIQGTYAIFRYKGLFWENIKTITIEIYKSIARADLLLKDTGIEFIEVYDQFYPETLNFEIHVPVVRKNHQE